MFQLSVVTPIQVFYEDEVGGLIAPGEAGYVGVLTGHAPLITSLKPGLLTIRDSLDTVVEFAIANGFLEMSNNRATILADAIEYVEKIDLERALAALERADNRIAGSNTTEDTDQSRAKRARSRALNRIDLKERLDGDSRGKN